MTQRVCRIGLAMLMAPAIVLLPGLVSIARAAGVTTYSGCLSLSSGALTKIAPGDVPQSPCNPGQVVVHLSGGDITDVQTPAAGGLQGGTDNGAASLSLQPGYKLPQTCAGGQVTKWDAGSASWVCGQDGNTTYSAGTGLDLSGSNQFSVAPSYQLPQSCDANQVVKWNGASWGCATETAEATARVAATDIVMFDDGGYLYNFGDIPGLSADITLSATGCITATWSAEILIAASADVSHDTIFFRATVDNEFFDGMEGQAIFRFPNDVLVRVVIHQPGDNRMKLVSYTTWQCGLSAGQHNVKVQWVVNNGTVVWAQSRTLVLEAH